MPRDGFRRPVSAQIALALAHLCTTALPIPLVATMAIFPQFPLPNAKVLKLSWGGLIPTLAVVHVASVSPRPPLAVQGPTPAPAAPVSRSLLPPNKMAFRSPWEGSVPMPAVVYTATASPKLLPLPPAASPLVYTCLLPPPIMPASDAIEALLYAPPSFLHLLVLLCCHPSRLPLSSYCPAPMSCPR